MLISFVVVAGYRPRTPAFRCARLLLRMACCRGRSLRSGETLLISFVVVGGCRPRTPAYRCARLLLRKAFCRRRLRRSRETLLLSFVEVEGCRPHTPLAAALGFSCGGLAAADARRFASLVISSVVDGGCRPRAPAFRCARLLLRRTFCHKQETCYCFTLPIVCSLRLLVSLR